MLVDEAKRTSNSVAVIPSDEIMLGHALRVSSYDRVAALLISLLIILGAAVFMMLVIWLTGRVFVQQAPVTPELIEFPGGGGGRLETAQDWVEPGDTDLEDLLEPELSQSVDAITDALTSQLATLETQGADAVISTRGGSSGEGLAGDEAGSGDNIPRWQRWEVLFSAANLDSYARQLDFFGIELGVLGTSNLVDYASDLSQSKPVRRSGKPHDEQRLYMTWRFGPLKDADTALLKKAGIATDGRVVVQFIPQQVENQLATLELAFAQANNRTIPQIAKTIFRVTGSAGQYAFEVKEQLPRPGR